MDHHHLMLALLAALSGCGSSAMDGEPDDWQPIVDLDACGFGDAPVAMLDISHRRDGFHSAGFARIEGSVQVSPALVRHEVVMTEGACRYLEPVAGGTCDPPCGANEFCDTGSACVPAPTGVGAGLLTIKGLGKASADGPIDIEPESFAPGTYLGPTDLPDPPFASQDEIGARFEGDAFPTATLGAKGVAAMDEALVTAGLELTDGADVDVTWIVGDDPDACVRIVLNGSNPVHGAPLDDIIECEGPDTGTLRVPRALVERFPIGATPELTEGFDWPASELTRYTRSRVQTAMGAAVMMVRSTAYFPIRHPG